MSTNVTVARELGDTLDKISIELRVNNIINIIDHLKKENLISEENYDKLLVEAAKEYDIIKQI